MSRSSNRVELLGRVGTEPELRQTRGGTAVCRLRLATERRSSGGESQTDWHNLVVWGKTAEAVAEYAQKGDRIYASGRLGYDSWENQDGQRRQTTEVHANEVVFLDNSTSRGAETAPAETSRGCIPEWGSGCGLEAAIRSSGSGASQRPARPSPLLRLTRLLLAARTLQRGSAGRNHSVRWATTLFWYTGGTSGAKLGARHLSQA